MKYKIELTTICNDIILFSNIIDYNYLLWYLAPSVSTSLNYVFNYVTDSTDGSLIQLVLLF